MEVMSEKSINIMLVVVVAILIGLGAILVLGATGTIEIPSGGFFEQLGRMFDFLERQVGLTGQESREWFCQKDLQDLIALCEITPGMLEEYCEMSDEEKIGTCQLASSEMKSFCQESWEKKEEICKTQNQFNAACDEIRIAKDIPSTKDLPFCK